MADTASITSERSFGDRPLRIAALILSILGIGVAGYLTYVHYADISPICAGGSGGCEKVQASDQSRLAGIPVALLGLLELHHAARPERPARGAGAHRRGARGDHRLRLQRLPDDRVGHRDQRDVPVVPVEPGDHDAHGDRHGHAARPRASSARWRGAPRLWQTGAALGGAVAPRHARVPTPHRLRIDVEGDRRGRGAAPRGGAGRGDRTRARARADGARAARARCSCSTCTS